MIRLFASPTLRQQAEQLDRVDQLSSGFHAALEAERDHAAEATREVPGRELVRRVGTQAGVADPLDGGGGFKPAGDRQGVGAVALDAKRQRLQTLQEEEGVERLRAGPGREAAARAASG